MSKWVFFFFLALVKSLVCVCLYTSQYVLGVFFLLLSFVGLIEQSANLSTARHISSKFFIRARTHAHRQMNFCDSRFFRSRLMWGRVRVCVCVYVRMSVSCVCCLCHLRSRRHFFVVVVVAIRVSLFRPATFQVYEYIGTDDSM